MCADETEDLIAIATLVIHFSVCCYTRADSEQMLSLHHYYENSSWMSKNSKCRIAQLYAI